MSEQRPHILLITTDQQRYDALGINGNRVLETPNLDHLAATGVNFTRAYSTCPVCIPARRTLLTGQSPDTHGMRGFKDGSQFNPTYTLPGELSKAGYQTQLIGKLHQHPQGKRFGFDNMILSESSNDRPRSATQKRNDYVHWLKQNNITEFSHSHGIGGNGRLCRPWGMEERFHHSNWLAEEASRFLTQTRDPSCPVFLHLSFFHPHPPLVPLQCYFDRYLRKDIPDVTLGEWCRKESFGIRAADAVEGPFDQEIIRRATAAYYALINHIDDCISRVLEQWLGYGSPDAGAPVYIMYSSDHGEMMGDHNLFRKSQGYESSAHIPYFISALNAPIKRGTSDNFVCWEDIPSTLLDLAGVEIPDTMEGVSLAPLVRDGTPIETRDHIFGQCEGVFHNTWVVNDRWKYIWFPKTNEEQLFDLHNDPKECRDLSGTAEEIGMMRQIMQTHVKDREDLDYSLEKLKPCGNKPPQVFWPEKR